MRIDVLTLFPEMFTPLKTSIIGRAVESGKLEINIVDIRDYTLDKHKKCDDTPFGGGAGMVMMPQPIASAINAVDPDHKAKRIYLSPKGRVFNQKIVLEYAKYERILLLCGHYEGVDQRVIDLFIDEELSVGDFVLTGGEIPAMAVVDAVARYVDGVINGESLEQESFASGVLEYPHYTRPQEFMGLKVPEVLVSGHHGKIDAWRAEKSLEIT
ncbi:MAG: tRNA (guanosine(37)-N1)-methyltransferase TrmD, partial [Clostridia bacterium]|nr:tRNA (guanosine(37)-N1)-methyltransferase TrmD [Clostridia bacterium]